MCRFEVRKELMEKNIKLISCFVFIYLALFVGKAYAILPPQPQDKILLYQNNTRILDDSVFYEETTNYNHKSICKKGICTIDGNNSSDSISIVFYKTSEDLLHEEDWKRKYYLEHAGCEGYVVQENEFYEAYYGWKNTDEYKQSVEKFTKEAYSNGIYQGIYNYIEQKTEPLLAEYLHKKGFTFYGNPNCIANYRSYLDSLKNLSIRTDNITFISNYGYPSKTFRLDLDTNKLKELNDLETISEYGTWPIIIFIIAFLVLIFSFFFFLFSRLFKLISRRS